VLLLVSPGWIMADLHRQIVPILLGASPILRDFGITAGAAGLLAAVYFPVYGVMQVLAGMVADRGGLNRLLAGACLLLAASGSLFAVAPTLEWALVARVLVGLASSFFWIPILRLCFEIAPRTYGRSVGILVSIGNSGTIASILLLPVALQLVPWRIVGLLICLPLLPLALAFYYLPVPAARARKTDVPTVNIGGLVASMRDLKLWRTAWPAMTWCGAWFGVLAWLPRYARDVHGVGSAASGTVTATMLLALVCCSWAVGWLTSRNPLLRRRLFLWAQGGVLLALLAIAMLSDRLGVMPLYLLAAVFGGLFGAFFLFMSELAADLPSGRVGAGTGFANGIGFLGAFVVPWLIGKVLDLVDRPTVADAVYSAAAYQAGWLVPAGAMVVGLAGAAVLWSRSREALGVSTRAG
jgi:MFS family permease